MLCFPFTGKNKILTTTTTDRFRNSNRDPYMMKVFHLCTKYCCKGHFKVTLRNSFVLFWFSQVGPRHCVSHRCESCPISSRSFTSRVLSLQPSIHLSIPVVRSPTARSTSSTGPYLSETMTGKIIIPDH